MPSATHPAWPPQLDLFEHARRYDPDTSKETARRVRITSQAIKVLYAYRLAGRALLDHDAYKLAGFPAGRTSHQRCSDLRHFGFIERTGRGVTPSGNSGYVCMITKRGLAYLLRIEGARK